MEIKFLRNADTYAAVKYGQKTARAVVVNANEDAMASVDLLNYDPTNEKWKVITKKDFELKYNEIYEKFERVVSSMQV